MNLNLVLVGGFCAVLLWVLVKAIRTGEFSIYERGAGIEGRSMRLRREDNPAGFWILAAGHVAAILFFVSWVVMP